MNLPSNLLHMAEQVNIYKFMIFVKGNDKKDDIYKLWAKELSRPFLRFKKDENEIEIELLKYCSLKVMWNKLLEMVQFIEKNNFTVLRYKLYGEILTSSCIQVPLYVEYEYILDVEDYENLKNLYNNDNVYKSKDYCSLTIRELQWNKDFLKDKWSSLLKNKFKVLNAHEQVVLHECILQKQEEDKFSMVREITLFLSVISLGLGISYWFVHYVV